MFGTKNHGAFSSFSQFRISLVLINIEFHLVGQSIGILFAWVAISCITLPLIQWFVRRNETKAVASVSSDDEESAKATVPHDDSEKTIGVTERRVGESSGEKSAH